ncbi:MAG: polymer-forming cytoskeletal protein [Verrucomicrobiota bacterium]|nr:polymer-forming cytoskeletal protein [Verrucomicrobiota bacterium]
MKSDTKTIIAEDVEITGAIKCASDIQIDGKLNGDMTCGNNVVVGATANIKGSLMVESISVLGAVNGNITAKDRIELKTTAKVNGDIKAKRLTVEDGVTFIGKSEVNPTGSAPAARAPESPATALPYQPPTVEEKKPGGMFGRK